MIEIYISAIEFLCNKEIILPIMTTFIGAWVAFKFNTYQIIKAQKNEQIANLNYLMVIFYKYLEEMDYFNAVIEKKLLSLSNCYDYCQKRHKLPSNMDENVLNGFAGIFYNKPKADIAIANYTFTDKNINFIISIIRSIQFIEDVYLGLETSNDMFEKFSDAHRGKVPDIKYYGDFIDVQIKNLKIIQEKTYQASYVIIDCIRVMAEYNNKYLKYKIADIKLSENLVQFIEKSRDIVENKYKDLLTAVVFETNK